MGHDVIYCTRDSYPIANINIWITRGIVFGGRYRKGGTGVFL